MNWRPLTNDNDVLRNGDMFRLWLSDQTWCNWAPVEASIGLTLRDFVQSFASRFPWHNGSPESMVEVRRPVTEGGV